MDICYLLQFILIDKPPQVKYWPKITSNSIPMFGTAISRKTPCLSHVNDVSRFDHSNVLGLALAQLVIGIIWSVNLCSQMWPLFNANFWLYLCVFCASVATKFSLFQLIYFRQFDHMLPTHVMSTTHHVCLLSYDVILPHPLSCNLPLSYPFVYPHPFLSSYPNLLSLFSGCFDPIWIWIFMLSWCFANDLGRSLGIVGTWILPKFFKGREVFNV